MGSLASITAGYSFSPYNVPCVLICAAKHQEPWYPRCQGKSGVVKSFCSLGSVVLPSERQRIDANLGTLGYPRKPRQSPRLLRLPHTQPCTHTPAFMLLGSHLCARYEAAAMREELEDS